jgi:hypothetical protein
MCRLSWNQGASTSWNPQGLSMPVMGLLYLLLAHSNKCSLIIWPFDSTQWYVTKCRTWLRKPCISWTYCKNCPNSHTCLTDVTVGTNSWWFREQLSTPTWQLLTCTVNDVTNTTMQGRCQQPVWTEFWLPWKWACDLVRFEIAGNSIKKCNFYHMWLSSQVSCRICCTWWSFCIQFATEK